MSDIAVVYASHYGFTETYARWIAEDLQADLLGSGSVRDLSRYRCVVFGGGLYACGGGLCAVYADNGRVLIRELIAPAGVAAADVAAALCAALGCREGQYMLPDSQGEPYLSAPAGILPPDCVWNLSFD